MDKIILKLKKELEKQGVSESFLARKAGVTQKKVNNLLSGKTKRLDPELISVLYEALGIAEDQPPAYGVTAIHRVITPEEENLLKILEEVPDVREAIEAMVALPPRKRKIHLGKMLEDLEKIEEGKD